MGYKSLPIGRIVNKMRKFPIDTLAQEKEY